eukprot:768320-Hanusia_phi.AAC.10
MSIDEHERLEFLDDVAHRHCLEVVVVTNRMKDDDDDDDDNDHDHDHDHDDDENDYNSKFDTHAVERCLNCLQSSRARLLREALCMAVFTGNLAAARAALALGASPDYASSLKDFSDSSLT